MTASRSRNDEDHAIVIGIERYLDRKVGDLNGARDDARQFLKWLTDKEGGAVRRRNVTLIAPPDRRSRGASLAALNRAFTDLCARARGRGSIGRRLYIYLAGHGVAQNRDETSLLAADSGPRALHRHVPGWCYASWFIYSSYFTEVVLFADCCRTAYRDLPVQPFPLAELESPAAGGVKYVRGFAVRYGQAASELDSEQPRGVFTSALVDALRNAYRDGRVTAGSVEAYLHNHPQLIAWRAFQEPSFVSEGEVVFATRPPERVPMTRVRLHVKGAGPPTVEGGPPPWSWKPRPGGRPRLYLADLPAGLYAVKTRGWTEYFEVSGRPGGVKDVPDR
jgi:caspase domain-containing protein